MEVRFRKRGTEFYGVNTQDDIKVILGSGKEFFVGEKDGQLSIHNLDNSVYVVPVDNYRLRITTDQPITPKEIDHANMDKVRQLEMF